MSIACILLAAGTGTRFGGEKLLYEVDGKPMAAHAIALHAALPYACRILITQRRHAELIALAKKKGFTVGYNDAPERGIASSIRIALELLDTTSTRPDGILFGVCDQPHLRPGTVSMLLDRFCSAPNCIVAPMANSRRGNPVIFPARFLPELAALEGDTGGSSVIRAHPEALMLVQIEDSDELADIDTRPDAMG